MRYAINRNPPKALTNKIAEIITNKKEQNCDDCMAKCNPMNFFSRRLSIVKTKIISLDKFGLIQVFDRNQNGFSIYWLLYFHNDR